ncbi:Vgb family protein [Niabella hirudinis]|uniref:Vgb family protein n=1 Tax=Niabella hirudinis TaxID=1285929 RepID=UPI003EB99376
MIKTGVFLISMAFLMPVFLKAQPQQQKKEQVYANTAFADHGPASAYSTTRGTVAVVDEKGRNVVLSWLFDVRGGYALSLVDAATGKSEVFPMPFNPGGDCPYASVFSSRGKFYTLFNSNFVEFDLGKRAFTFHHKTAPQMAMGMTEDDKGKIWAVTYPNSGVVCFDPATGAFTDYGYLNKENWQQYQRYMATDDQGWVYFALGNTNSQLIAFNPESRQVNKLLQPAERKRGTAYLYPDKNGKVYGQALADTNGAWYEMYEGRIKPIGTGHRPNEKPIITGSQALRHLSFPDGSKVTSLNLIDKVLITEDAHGKKNTVNFDYPSEGSWVMGVGTSPDQQSLIGGSSFPMRQFNYTAAADKWSTRPAFGQYNALTTSGSYVFFGSYPGGVLVMWDTKKPFKEGSAMAKDNNPRVLFKCTPVIHRPHRVLVHPDGKTVILGGTPEYGYTGGGLLFYDITTNKHVLLTDNDIEKDQSTMSLTNIAGGKVLGGTTVSPGTGGEQKARLALLYIIDPVSKKLMWKEPVIAGAKSYTDLTTRKDGKVYGIADRSIFFLFDPQTKKVIFQKDVRKLYGNTVGEQSPRVFINGEGDDLYILFENAITKVDPQTSEIRLLSKTPQAIRAGGCFLKNQIYFISGSHLFSYTL